MANISGGTITWTLDADTSKFNKALIQARGKAGTFGQTLSTQNKELEKQSSGLSAVVGKLGKVGWAAAITGALALGTAVAKNIGPAIKRVDTLANSARTFENMGFSAKETGKAMSALDLSIRGLPTSLDSAVRNVQLFAASTNDIGKSQKIFSALNNAVLGFGGTSEQVTNATIQLSQAFANGRVDGITWLSMINSGLGPALNAIARDMGITTGQLKKGLSDGSISVEKFQDALIKMNTKGGGGMKSFQQIAKDSTKGIGTSFENMGTAIQRGLANIINAIGRDKIANLITNIGKGFEVASKQIILFARFLQSLWASAQPILIPMINMIKSLINTLAIQLAPAIEFVKRNMDAFKLVGKALMVGLLVPLVVAIVGVVKSIIIFISILIAVTWTIRKLWQVGSATLSAFVALNIATWNAVKNATVATWQAIYNFFVSVFRRIKAFFSGAMGWLYSAGINIVRGLVNGIRAGAGAVSGAVSSVSARIGAFFRGAGGWLWDTGRAIIQGLIGGIRSMAGEAANAAKGVANDAIQGAKNVLGIHSPSKVFHEIGQNVSKGMALGIDKSAPLASKAVSSLSNLSGVSPIMPTAVTPASSSASQTSGPRYTIGTINISSEVDGERWIKKLTRDDAMFNKGLIAPTGF